MNVTSGGSHKFRCFTPADTSRVWNALTDGDPIRHYLHGLSVESSWCTGTPIRFLASPEVDGRCLLGGIVLCVQPGHLLSFFLTSGQDDPATYLTWQ